MTDMNKENDLSYKINAILTSWNPIEVPDFLAEEEYTAYVKPIISIGNNSNLLKNYFINMITEQMGLLFDESNKLQKISLDEVIKKIIELYQ